jgi:hypothetical protein
MGVIALVVSALLIMLEFAADTGFCYYNPVIPLMVVPLSTPRGIYLPFSHCLSLCLEQYQPTHRFLIAGQLNATILLWFYKRTSIHLASHIL